MADYFHHVPGRLRVKFAQLRNNPSLAQEIEIALRTIPEVTRAEVCIRTGSVLMRYQQSRSAQEKLFAVIRQLDRKMAGVNETSNVPSTARQTPGPIAKRMAEKLVGVVIKKHIDRSAFALLGMLL